MAPGICPFCQDSELGAISGTLRIGAIGHHERVLVLGQDTGQIFFIGGKVDGAGNMPLLPGLRARRDKRDIADWRNRPPRACPCPGAGHWPDFLYWRKSRWRREYAPFARTPSSAR